MRTLQDLRTAISAEMGDLFRSTGSGSAGAATVTDPVIAGAYPDGYFRGAELYALPIARAFRILDFAGATGTFTLNAALPSTLTSATYEIRRVWLAADVDRAINGAIRDVAGYHFAPVTDQSLVLVAGQYEYPLPANWLYVTGVEVQTPAGHFARLHPLLWRTAPGRKLAIRYETVWKLAGRALRLSGLTGVRTLTNDSDATTVPDAYLVPAARARLYEAKAGGSQTDPDAHRTSAQTLRALAEARRNLARTDFPPNTRRVLD